MKRLFPIIGALLVATGLAWAQFNGVDSPPEQHFPTQNALSFIISGAPVGGQTWALGLPVNLLFPGNFLGNAGLDGIASVTCGTNPGETDIYTFKCAGNAIGNVTIAGSGAPALTQQAVNGVGGATTVTANLVNNVKLNNFVVAIYDVETASFNPSFTLSTGTAGPGGSSSTATVGPFSTCPANGTPIQDSSMNASVIIAYARVTAAGTLGITATLGGAEPQGMNVSEFSGLAASPLDGCGGGSTGAGATGTALSTGSSGGTLTGDLILADFGTDCNTPCTISGLTAGYTALTAGLSDSAAAEAFGAYNVATAPATITATLSAAHHWAGVALALKAAGGSGCAPTFATMNGNSQLCQAGQRFEMDAPGTVSGADIGITVPAHTP